MKHRDAADVVLFASSSELAEMNPPRRKKTLEHPVLDSLEYEGFLVKTALIRSESWDKTKQVRVTSSADVYDVVKHLAHYDQEHMVSLAVSNGGYLTAIHESAIGTASAVSTQARILVKVALLTNSPGIIVVHNHPSGFSEPSMEDRKFTKNLMTDLDCFQIRLLDHIIVAADGYTSFADRELL